MMFKMLFTAAQILFIFVSSSAALSTNDARHNMNNQRRSFLIKSLGTAFGVAATTTMTTTPAFALDMDAFMNSELSKDNKNAQEKNAINDDAVSCRYGAPGPETGDACVRAGLPTTRKAGGVDAYGKIDRGDYVRCTTKWSIVGDHYEKFVTCTDSQRSYMKEGSNSRKYRE
jgi:hypothetical protein